MFVAIYPGALSRGNSAYGKLWNCAPVQTYDTQMFYYYYLCQEDMILPAFVCLWVTFTKSYKQILMNYFI